MVALGLTRFFTSVFLFSIGFGIMTPAVPLFASLSIGANEWELGILGALAATPYVMGPTLLGRLSDKVGRKPLILGGLLIYVITCILYTVSTNLLQLGILRVCEGVSFSAIWPSAEAYVGDHTLKEKRVYAVGLYSVAWSSGYMVGPFIMGTILNFTGITMAFVVTAIFMSLGFLSIFFLSKPKELDTGYHQSNESSPIHKKSIFSIIYTMVIWGFVMLSFFFLFPSYAGENGIIPSQIAYLVGIVAMVRTMVFFGYNIILRKIGHATLPLGMFCLSIAMFLAWGVPTIMGFVATTMFLGLSLGLLYAYSLAYMLNRPAKGLYAGLFESAIGLGELIGPLAMGYVGFLFIPSFPYLCLSILGILSAVLLAFTLRDFSIEGP